MNSFKLPALISRPSYNRMVLFLLFPIIAAITIGVSSFYPAPQVNASRDIVQKMFASCDKVKSLKFKLKKKERVNGVILTGEQDVKFIRSPKKIYTKVIAPAAGTEVLFVEGTNSNKAWVHPNSFPYVTVSLDPYSSAMRNNNHHTVHEVGFDYIKSIVNDMWNKSGANFDKIFSYKGDTVVSGRKCFKVGIDYFDFKFINYTVKENESLVKIAYKNFVSDYMILTMNSAIKDYSDVKPGQVIKIPNAYAKYTQLCIDKETYLPLLQQMYDEKGLFSEYHFIDLVLNPSFEEIEFSKENKSYKF